MTINAIAAIDQEWGIGKEGGIPFRDPTDMKLFKLLTLGCPVVMGRKTYESLPEMYRPLPGRVNVVFSRDESFRDDVGSIPNVLPVANMSEFYDWGKDREDTVWIIGGGEVYDMFFPAIKEFYITRFKVKEECDTFLDKNRLGTFLKLGEVDFENIRVDKYRSLYR